MKEYKFDKTAFKMMTFEEADMENIFEPDVPYAERKASIFSYFHSILFFKRKSSQV